MFFIVFILLGAWGTSRICGLMSLSALENSCSLFLQILLQPLSLILFGTLIPYVENPINRFNIRLDTTEKETNNLKYRTMEIIQNREKKNGKHRKRHMGSREKIYLLSSQLCISFRIFIWFFFIDSKSLVKFSL